MDDDGKFELIVDRSLAFTLLALIRGGESHDEDEDEEEMGEAEQREERLEGASSG